jgi:type VI secretion system secreted protein VgrG
MAGTDDQVLEASQQGRLLTVQIGSLDQDLLLPTSLIGHEAISSMFSFNLDLISQKPEQVVFDQIIGEKVSIAVRLADDSRRFFNGFVSRIAQVGRDIGSQHRFTRYQVEVVPWLWFLSKIADCRIFQDQTVPEIVNQVFEEMGFTDFQLNLSRTYTKWDYCVQYRESDFQFVSRLMEEEGIFYFFEHDESSHTLVMADSPNVYKTCPGQPSAIFQPEGGIGEHEDNVTSWVVEQELHSGKVTNRDHHFEMPDKTLEFSETTRFDVAQNNKLELYDYPGGYAEKFNKPGQRLDKVEPEGRVMVELQMEEQETPHLIHQASSECRAFMAGTKFELKNPPPGVAEGPYVLTSIQHAATQDAGFVSSSEAPFTYNNTFSCVTDETNYRPRRITPKPIIAGPQTAVVVGPAGEEIFTDKFGRVKVQFHWDRQGKKDADSSCWIRVAQTWAGKRWGASFWPRIGQEVVVGFLEGDPDQPIIVGSVYNADQMPPYLGDGLDSKHKNDNKLTGVKSNTTKGGVGFNEWRFDDTKGKEQIFMHAERNMDVRVKNESMERVVSNRHLIVGYEKDGKKGGDQKEKIFQDKHLHVMRHQQEQIEGNVWLTVGKGQAEDGGNQSIVIEKSKFEHIGDQDQLHVDGGQFISIGDEQHITVKNDKLELLKANSHLHVLSNRNEKVDANQSLTVGGNQQEKVGGNHALDASMQIHLKAGMTVIIEAGMQLSLKVGGSFVDIGPTGVTIQGPMVLINSGGAAGSGAGSSPTAPDDATPPEDADQATPAEPAVADDSVTGSKSAPK